MRPAPEHKTAREGVRRKLARPRLLVEESDFYIDELICWVLLKLGDKRVQYQAHRLLPNDGLRAVVVLVKRFQEPDIVVSVWNHVNHQRIIQAQQCFQLFATMRCRTWCALQVEQQQKPKRYQIYSCWHSWPKSIQVDRVWREREKKSYCCTSSISKAIIINISYSFEALSGWTSRLASHIYPGRTDQ